VQILEGYFIFYDKYFECQNTVKQGQDDGHGHLLSITDVKGKIYHWDSQCKIAVSLSVIDNL